MKNYFGENLKENRLSKGLSLRKLAAEIGYSATDIQKLEKGLLKPDSGVMIAVCNYFKLSYQDILNSKKLNIDFERFLGKVKKEEKIIVNNLSKNKIQGYLDALKLLKGSLNIGEFLHYLMLNKEANKTDDRVLNVLGPGCCNLVNVLEKADVAIIEIDYDFEGKVLIAENTLFIIIPEKIDEEKRVKNIVECIILFLCENSEEIAYEDVVLNKNLLQRYSGNKIEHITKFELECMCKMLSVSIKTLAKRMKGLGIISRYTYKSILELNLDIKLIDKRPEKFKLMVCNLFSKGIISESRAAEMLDITTVEFVEKFE